MEMRRLGNAGPEVSLVGLGTNNFGWRIDLEASRKVIDRAKGILQRELGLTEEEAYVTIQRQSRQRRKTKKEIAEAIIIGDEVRLSRDGG